MAAWISLTKGIDNLTITEDMIDLKDQVDRIDYEDEEVSTVREITVRCPLAPLGRGQGEGAESASVISRPVLSRLLNGMLYKGEYKSGSGELLRGLTDADDDDDFPPSLAPEEPQPWTEAHYQTLLKRTLECWDNSSMIVVADPHATDGKLKVYMKRDCTDSSHNHTTVTHPTETDYYLFYRTDVDRSDRSGK